LDGIQNWACEFLDGRKDWDGVYSTLKQEEMLNLNERCLKIYNNVHIVDRGIMKKKEEVRIEQ